MKHLRFRGCAGLIAGVFCGLATAVHLTAQTGTGTLSPGIGKNIGATPPRQIGVTLRLDF